MNARGKTMVELDHLGKNFDTEVAVRDVSLLVAQGEFVTLLGPSGCGKTTTLRCLAGLERPDAGEIRIDGETVASGVRLFLSSGKEQCGCSSLWALPTLPIATLPSSPADNASASRSPARLCMSPRWWASPRSTSPTINPRPWS